MKYYIKRGENEYGPYTLADVQRYVGQGNILMTDQARSEGLSEWVPVAQVLGNIPVPVPAMPGTSGTTYGGTPAYGAATMPVSTVGPVPPDFHWALVLLIGILTCTVFLWAWYIVEAAWIRKIKPQSNGLVFVVLSLGCSLASSTFRFVWIGVSHRGFNPFSPLLSLACIALFITGAFIMRGDLEDYYNSTENIGLRLSGVMTLFFPVFYFQHHFSRIAQWKKTGILQPQG